MYLNVLKCRFIFGPLLGLLVTWLKSLFVFGSLWVSLGLLVSWIKSLFVCQWVSLGLLEIISFGLFWSVLVCIGLFWSVLVSLGQGSGLPGTPCLLTQESLVVSFGIFGFFGLGGLLETPSLLTQGSLLGISWVSLGSLFFLFLVSIGSLFGLS